MKGLKLKLYHWVHSTGLVADWLYAGAHQLRSRTLRRRNRSAANAGFPVAELSKFHHEPRRVIDLNVGITNICNARCNFCAYPRVVDGKTLQTGVMPLATFKKAVDQFAQNGGHYLDLTPVVGDPLVDPEVFEKVRYATLEAKLGYVGFYTNAILLNHKDNYRRLIDSGIHFVSISTQGTDRELYKKVYGVDKYDQVISGIQNLLEYNRSKGEPVRVVIEFRNAQKPSEIIRSADYQQKIKPYFSEKVRVNFTIDYDNWGGRIEGKDMLGVQKLRVAPEPVNLPCQRLFAYSVRHDGSVRLCACRLLKSDFDDLIVGNLHQTSFTDVIRGERAWNIIEGFFEGKRPEVCRGCTMYKPVTPEWLAQRQLENKQGLSGDFLPRQTT